MPKLPSKFEAHEFLSTNAIGAEMMEKINDIIDFIKDLVKDKKSEPK